MKSITAAVVVAAMAMATAGTAAAGDDDDAGPSGIMVEVNAGPSYAFVGDDAGGGRGQEHLGYGALDVAIGDWVTPTIALRMRAASSTFQVDDGVMSGVRTQTLIGPDALVWLSRRAFVGMGSGLTTFLVGSGGNGYGADVRFGAPLSARTGAGQWTASLETSVAVYSDANVFGLGLLIGWQSY